MNGSYNCDKRSLKAIFRQGRIVWRSLLLDSFVAVGKRGTGDGALHAGIAGRESAPAKAREEIGAVEATALGSGGRTRLNTKNVIIIGPTLSLPTGW